MFDIYTQTKVINSGPSKVHVTEERAPTDDSIRLYREMLDKARSEILETLHCKNDLVDAWLVLVKEYGLQNKVMVVFKLNGVPYQVEAHYSYVQSMVNRDRDELAKLVIDTVSRAIAEKLWQRADSL